MIGVMRPTPQHGALVETVIQAAVVAGWMGMTFLLVEVIFGTSIPVDGNSPFIWLCFAAVAVFYPVWTILVLAMAAQTVRGLVDRLHRS